MSREIDRAIAGSDLRRLAFSVQQMWEPTRCIAYLTDMERHQLAEVTRGLFAVSAALLDHSAAAPSTPKAGEPDSSCANCGVPCHPSFERAHRDIRGDWTCPNNMSAPSTSKPKESTE